MQQNSNLTVVKAGLVYRLSDILQRWKREWCVIYLNGIMKFYKKENDRDVEKRIDLVAECKHMLHPSECSSTCPDSKSRNCIFGFKTVEDRYWFVANDEDDALAWRMVIEQFIGAGLPEHVTHPPRPASSPMYMDTPPAYTNNGGYYYNQPPPYPHNQQAVMYGNQGQYLVPQTVINHPDGTQTIYVNGGADPAFCCEYGCRSRHHCCHYNDAGLGLGLGLATGAMLMTPFMWGPWIW